MKKKNLLRILLILVCIGVLYGYRTLDALKTDTEAPQIHMDGAVPEISVSDPDAALLKGITAQDDRDGDVTASLVVERMELLNSDGSLMVSYAAFDRAGNVAKAQREAVFTDYESPRFTLKTPLIYRYGTNFDVLSTVGATDVMDGEIQHRVRATSLSNVSIAEQGTHDVQFQVSNSLGDTASLVLPVEVSDMEQYAASLTLEQYILYLKTGDTFQPKSWLGTFTLMGEETSLAAGLPANYSLKNNGEVNTQMPGVYPVEYRVTYTQKHETDPARDREYTGYSKLIVVVEG